MLKCHTWPRHPSGTSCEASQPLMRNNQWYNGCKQRNTSNNCVCTSCRFPQAECWSHEGDSLPLPKILEMLKGRKFQTLFRLCVPQNSSKLSGCWPNNMTNKTPNLCGTSPLARTLKHQHCHRTCHPKGPAWQLKATQISKSQSLRIHPWCMRPEWHTISIAQLDLRYQVQKSQSLRISADTSMVHETVMTHTIARSPAFAYWPMPCAWLESAGNFIASSQTGNHQSSATPHLWKRGSAVGSLGRLVRIAIFPAIWVYIYAYQGYTYMLAMAAKLQFGTRCSLFSGLAK